MTMEAQPSQDGRTRVFLGPVERWAATAVAGGIVLGVIWLVGSVQTVLTQQQVMNQQVMTVQQQLQVINSQLADVPALKLEVAKLSIQVEQNKADVKELKQLRSVR